jgi:Heparinase II/III-like protein/Heparinase II/III N-terminus
MLNRLANWMGSGYGAAIQAGVAALVLGSIWYPEFAHWYVNPTSATPIIIDAARRVPDQGVLEEVIAMRVGAVTIGSKDVVFVAEKIMQGSLDLPGFQAVPLTLPFSASDLLLGTPTFQLAMASLVSADVLLDAFRVSGREEFLTMARDQIVEFAKYEAKQWLDHGMLWNDHAIAARAPVLVKFWAAYRGHPRFEPAVGRLVLDLVARSAQMLAKPAFYAWRTGHGIVADVAILQMAVAFPDVEGIAALRGVAASRFAHHLPYWINAEGVTLLHSAGYHSPGLFGIVLRLHSLSGISIPLDWWQRYASALRFDALLRRPDDTLPMYGDTMSIPRSAALITERRTTDGAAQALSRSAGAVPANGLSVFPAAGHAIAWDGMQTGRVAQTEAAQTVMTWSYYPALGHKIADELSVMMWAVGRTWITNTGYWPYGVQGREQAESWEASNAPHLSQEPKNSVRETRVRGVGQVEGMTVIDLERSRPDGYIVRRQLIRLVNENSWLVLDHADDSFRRSSTTNWTFYPDLLITAQDRPGVYIVSSPHSSQVMVSAFSGSEGVNFSVLAGHRTPFAGWVVLDRTPTPASAVVVRQPSNDSWSLATFTLMDSAKARLAPWGGRMLSWIDAEHWALEIPGPSGWTKLMRVDHQVQMQHQGSKNANLVVDLKALDAPEEETRQVQVAMLDASKNFHKFRELINYRIRVSYLLFALWIGQEMGVIWVRRKYSMAMWPVRAGLLFAWAAAGIWVGQIYFTAPP